MRVIEHPVLGHVRKRKPVEITVDGKVIEAFEGEPIAVALLAAGIRVFRKSRRKAEPRGVFCCVGHCTDCILKVNGKPNVRACVIAVEHGMRIETE